MQHELELLEDLSNETVDSAARKGRKIGHREATSEFAKRLIQLGSSDEFIQAATLLSADEISKIKNGT